MEIDRDWWKQIFDETYLLTDARSVCDDALTKREADYIEGFLEFRKEAPVLDMCGGQGRHSLELARRGYRDLTVLDYSDFLIAEGRKKAEEEGLHVRFCQGDARETKLKTAAYLSVILMASSFGYFTEDRENMKILHEVHRLLQNRGKVLLDLPDRDRCHSGFKPFSTHPVNEQIRVERTRELKDDVLYSRELVISEAKGIIRDASYCIRLFTPEKISALLKQAGFERISFNNEFLNRERKGDFGSMTSRMTVVAVKKQGHFYHQFKTFS